MVFKLYQTGLFILSTFLVDRPIYLSLYLKISPGIKRIRNEIFVLYFNFSFINHTCMYGKDCETPISIHSKTNGKVGST